MSSSLIRGTIIYQQLNLTTMDKEYLYCKERDEEQSLMSLMDEIYTSTMQKVGELSQSFKELKEKIN